MPEDRPMHNGDRLRDMLVNCHVCGRPLRAPAILKDRSNGLFICAGCYPSRHHGRKPDGWEFLR